ncbi:MAG: Mur ligase family protein [Actinomycetota bacterium]
MGRADPFTGYSILVRVIVYGVVPLFGVWQFLRLKRALHVFQLEGYKRARFLEWCAANRERALFLGKATAKKPLVMTGRATRILTVATALSMLLVLGLSGVAHLAGGAPFDLITWVVVTVLVFVGAPVVLVLADVVLTPAQGVINGTFLRRARAMLAEVSPLVVGVTGSFGKTSTKFAIEALIGPAGSALATPGSFNTPLGVCRTINENLDSSHGFFIVEMGAYKEGEIAELCRFVRPSIGVLTAIGPAHLERFGSMDAIRRGKYEIVTSLPDEGTAVMNVDNLDIRKLADETRRVTVVRYGLDEAGAPDITCRNVRVSSSGTAFEIVDTRDGRAVDVTTRLLGKHSVGHILAGAAVALLAGRALADLRAPIANLQPVEHRLQLIQGTGGITVIDDAFNSNPEGAAAALDVLAAMPGGKKVVVTPGIIELGPLQAEANEDFGARAAEVADAVIVVARINRDAILAGARRAGAGRSGGADVIAVGSLDEATARLRSLIGPGDVVLFENDLPDQYEN